MMRRTVKIFLIIFLFNLINLTMMSSSANAAGATLFISPGSGDKIVNKNFTVKVMVNSGGDPGINAAEGVIKYDSSALLVTAVNKGSSIFNLWTTEPTFSNTSGIISFGGGSPSSYKGNAGSIFTVTFTPKKVGETEVNFTSGLVLAADGKGTNVFSGFGNAKFNIKEEEKKEEPKKEEPKKQEEEKKSTGIQPPLPEISTKTHSDENVWYSNNDPEFSWKILPDLIGVSYMVTDSAISDPGPKTDGVVESAIIEDQADGEWYFHLKYRNNYGWGPIAHKKFMVDVTPPEKFDIALDTGGDSTNPSPKLKFTTTDKTSGIDSYMAIIDGRKVMLEKGDVSKGYYEIDPVDPKSHTVQIIAIDKAGNSASSSISFIVDPLKAPIITSIPKVINKKDELIIQGTSFYPNIMVEIFISKGGNDPDIYTTKTDDNGNWSYFHKKRFEDGNYDVWARLIDDRGAKSLNSAKYLLIVEPLSIIERYGLLIIIILLLIIILESLYIYYITKKYNEERSRIMRETLEVKTKLGKIFAALREEVDELIQMADKKQGLSDSERRVKERLQESLDISEEFINKEVEDVEKEIKMPKGKK